MENVFTAILGESSLKIVKFTREGIYFSELIGEVGQTVIFLFCANADGVALEIPVSGKLKKTPDGCVVPVALNEAQSSALRTLFNVSENSNLHDIAKILYRPNSAEPNLGIRSELFSMAVMGALCLVLIASVSYVKAAKQISISALAAFIATDALVLESNSSGLVEYLAKPGDIRMGEVYAAIRTKSGRSVFLESTAAGTLQNAGAHAGQSIVKGNPLAYLASPSDTLFVKAYVATATAAKLPNGYGAEIEVVDGTVSRLVKVASISASDIARDFQFSDQIGNPLAEVTLPLQKFPGLSPGQTVSVRFIDNTTSIIGTPFREFGNMLQGWMNSSGARS
jgi:hypothetical protein